MPLRTFDSPIDALYELGVLYFERGDFSQSLQRMRAACEWYLREHNFCGYLKCLRLLLQIYGEMDDAAGIEAAQEQLHSLLMSGKFEFTAPAHTVLSLFFHHRNQSRTALEHVEKALALALDVDDKESSCHAISARAHIYTALGRLEEALGEISQLNVFFQILDLGELELPTQILYGNVLRRLGRFDESLETFGSCFEVLRRRKNFYHYLYLLYGMGLTYIEAGDRELGRMHLSLARRALDPEHMKTFTRILDQKLEELGGSREVQYDIVFDSSQKVVVERKKGPIDFKNQFVLLDLLRLFLRNPGEVFSKEAIVRRVWKQEYDPQVHDNKIYVTIKRLRKMIEPDYEKPRYIFRSKNGYYLNRNAKVHLEQ